MRSALQTYIEPHGDQDETSTKRVLIVEDDEAMAVALRDGFLFEGYDVKVASDGDAGLAAAGEEKPDLIVLDVMLPKMSGFDLCQQLRSAGNSVPIIMLTARGQEIDKVLGLKLGADDYITKPFSFMELMARVEAVLRRAGRHSDDLESVRFGDITVDFKRHEATKAGEPLDLSPREFKMLRYLLERRGEVVSREELLRAVWDYNSFPFTRTVDMHVAKLRKKLGDDPANPVYLVTVHRAGYKFIG
jgi:DNA-binding response OmpR family regulator